MWDLWSSLQRGDVCRELSRLQTRLDGAQGREAPGVTEQRKHRRRRKAPYAPAFLFRGYLLAASVGHRIWGRVDPSFAQGTQQCWKC